MRLRFSYNRFPYTIFQSQVTSPQSPVTSPQSPVPSHQSPVTSPQSPVPSHQSPVPSNMKKPGLTGQMHCLSNLAMLFI
ncbi:hypothetical protein [Sphaerospermopsis reniformis]|uniref:hypothetical protein n=1 Tax=Sphaerospermopsis reniformis TaxID=531300 RepID=UPI0010F53CFC|nr:hypothetical protein [Sphaerospermopsis reniformis]